MQEQKSDNRRALLWAVLIPGLGHLVQGRKNLGVHISGATLLLATLLYLRWEAFWAAWANPHISEWSGSLSMVVFLAVCWTVSVVGTYRYGADGFERGTERSPLAIARRRFVANRLAVAAFYTVLLLYLCAFLAPILAPYDPALIDNVMDTRYLAPSLTHPFGTDEFGRDLFSRALFGARVSLSVGLLSVLIAVSFGTVYGSLAGFIGGVFDNLLMRAVDVFNAFPTFFLMLLLVGVFEAGITLMILILGLTSWTGTARLIRGEILSLKERKFIEAARAVGLPDYLILFRHLIPNALAPVLVSAALMVGGMIGAEAGLSFLGIGIQPPTPTWGNMVSSGQNALLVAWWIAFFPGSLLALTILSFNLLADGLRDAVDPKTLTRKYL